MAQGKHRIVRIKRKAGKVGKVMHEFKQGELHSGSSRGPVVTDRAQAVAIGLSEARKAGENVPLPKRKLRIKRRK